MSLAEALTKAGFDRAEMELGAAVTKFLKSGGTIAAAHAVVDATAKRMSGRGQDRFVSNDPGRNAPTRQRVEDGGAIKLVSDEDQRATAALSSSNRGGSGHASHAPVRHMAGAIPVREPSKTQRAVAGIIAKASAVTVLDTLKIDGRAIGDWTPAEALRAGPQKTREGYILVEAARYYANAPSGVPFRNLIKPDVMQKIMQKAAEISDAA